MAHSIIALYRLSTFDEPDWDRGLVRDTANLSLILGQLVTQLAHVKAAVGLDLGSSEDTDLFNTTSRTLGSIKTWWDSKVAAETVGPATAGFDETMAEVPMELLDDTWLKDILGAGPYQFEPYLQ